MTALSTALPAVGKVNGKVPTATWRLLVVVRREFAMVGRRPRTSIAVIVLSLLAGVVAVLPLSSAPPTGGGERSVAGQALVAAPAAPDPEGAAVPAVAPPVWPQARRVSVDLPAQVSGVTLAPTGPASPHRIDVEILDQNAVSQRGGTGIAVRLASEHPGDVQLSLDYDEFRHAYGGGFADRVRLARIPDCAGDCPRPDLIPADNNTKHGALTAQVPTGAVYTLVTAAAGDSGDYRATDLKPSGKWLAGSGSGEFTYSYPLTLPTPPYGSAPDLALRYSSGSVDGRTSASNNQASWVGLGWDLNPGFIERRYRNCVDDGQTQLSDLCWHSPYAGDEDGAAYVISVAGVTTELIRASDGSYRMRDDRGYRLEHKFDGQNSDNSNEYWIVSAPDGTRYRFGYREDSNLTVPVVGDDAGEPCKGSAWCRQTWRWSEDQVVDRNDNLTNLYWTKETNYYKRWNNSDKVSYDRGDYLDRVEYGMRGSEHPTVQVDFTTGYRCSSDVTVASPNCAAPTSSSTEGEYPDVPRDLICTSGQDCKKYSPTFFVTRRLTGVVTKVWDPPTAAYLEVNRYQPTFAFVNPSGPTDPMLWLNQIQVSGKFGDAVTMPVVDFDGSWLNNRVDYPSGDTAKALPFRRLTTIRNGLGGETRITYGHATPAATCPSNGADSSWESAKKWDTNDQECYRQEFKPDGGSKTKGVFHKYVTTKVEQVDLVGGSPTRTTTYAYVGKAAWHHDDDLVTPSDQQTWTDWRGYPTVRVTEGTGPNEQRSVTESTYFRGMDGDKLSSGTRDVTITDYSGTPHADNHAKAGSLLQERKYRLNADGTSTELASKRLTYWDSGITANGPGLHNAHMIRGYDTFGRDMRADGTWQETSQRSDGQTVANGGQPLRTVDWGEPGTADDLCTEIRYATNTAGGKWLLTYEESSEQHTGQPDQTTGECFGTAIARTVTLYDGATAPGTPNAPTAGNPTLVRRYWNDTSYAAERKAYDDYGRVTEATDAVGFTTTTSYNPTSGWPLNGVVTTNPLGQSTTEFVSRAWGRTVKSVDPNGLVTNQDYDAVGRIRRVWLPTEPKQTGPEVPPPAGAVPSIEYGYRITFTGTGQPTKPTVVTTKRLQNLIGDQQFLMSYSYMDGQGRVREVQTPSPGAQGGRIVTVTAYDDRGLTKGTSRPLWNATAPGDNPDLLLNPATTTIPSWSEKTYDALEREASTTLYGAGQVKATTKTANYGNGKVVTPPRGGRTAYWNDGRDRLVKVQENVPVGSDVPPASAATTSYSYNGRGDLNLIVDAVGNRTEYTTDWLGRRTYAKDPDAGTSTTSYDPAGKVLATTDTAGNTVSFTYDSLGRKRVEWSGAVGGTKSAEWTYDTVLGAKGKPAAETRYVNGNAYTVEATDYDPRYRVMGRKWTIPASEPGLAGIYSFGYDYDRADHQTSITYPAAGGLPAETVTTAYTPTGVPDRMASDLGGYVDRVSYSGTGQLLSRVTGSAERRYTYEPTGPQRLSTVETLVAGSRVQLDAYGYDAADNVTSVTDRSSAQNQCYTYDPLQRVTASWTNTAADCSTGADHNGPDPYHLEYTFDPVGNLKSLSDDGVPTTYNYPTPGPNTARPHAVTAVGTDTFGYDGQGQLTTRTVAGRTSTLAWDNLGRLASVTAAGTTSTFVYEADGDRLIRHDPDATTLYLEGMEIRQGTGNPTGSRYYTHDQALVALRTSTLTWIGNDPQATVQVAVNAVSNGVSRQRYLPFGAHRGGRDDITETDRGFLGKVEDPSGLVQVGARYYDPVTGKFISTDPLYDQTKPQSLNPYTYAQANPATYSDPTGLKPCEGSTGEDRCAPGYHPGDGGHGSSGGGGHNSPPAPGSDPHHCIGIECVHGGEPRDALVPPLPPTVISAPVPLPPAQNCTVTPTNQSYPAAHVSGKCGSSHSILPPWLKIQAQGCALLFCGYVSYQNGKWQHGFGVAKTFTPGGFWQDLKNPGRLGHKLLSGDITAGYSSAPPGNQKTSFGVCAFGVYRVGGGCIQGGSQGDGHHYMYYGVGVGLPGISPGFNYSW
jgi:RHS repeat-associated protein